MCILCVCYILSRFVVFLLILKVAEEEEVGGMEVAAEVVGNFWLSV